MAVTVRNGWVMFGGDYSCRLSDIAHVYSVPNNSSRIMLVSGGAFYVPETYADVMRAVIDASD